MKFSENSLISQKKSAGEFISYVKFCIKAIRSSGTLSQNETAIPELRQQTDIISFYSMYSVFNETESAVSANVTE